MRAELEKNGLSLPRGFHAVNDANRTRNDVYRVIKEQAPRFDATFLWKAKAYPAVRARGQMYLYKMAWFLHFKEIARQVSDEGDTLYVIVGTFGTAARKTAAIAAVRDVCGQVDRNIVLCPWESSSSWGLQVADYGLWAVQRKLEGKICTWYEPCVMPTLSSFYTPWGYDGEEPTIPAPGRGRHPLGVFSSALPVCHKCQSFGSPSDSTVESRADHQR